MRQPPILILAACLLSVAACGTDDRVTSGGGGPMLDPCGLVSTVLASSGTGAGGATSSASASSAGSTGGGGSSAATSSAGAGGSDADCGCDDDIATRSGTRLEVLSARSEDGASRPVGFYDVTLQCGCEPELRPDGVVRCTPVAGCPSWQDSDLAVMTIEAGQ